MNIQVAGRKMPITDALRSYALEKVGHSLSLIDIDPMTCEVVLMIEKNPANPRPAICEVTVTTIGHVIRVEESEEDMYAAIDVAAAKVARQIRKFKTRVVERKSHDRQTVRETSGTKLSLDDLMEELSADEEVVRVKELEFEPLTEEEALIKIDLLGHDFFAYTDRDTNLVHILYRRHGGGYGLLKQKD